MQLRDAMNHSLRMSRKYSFRSRALYPNEVSGIGGSCEALNLSVANGLGAGH
jgi:hypothetical protein